MRTEGELEFTSLLLTLVDYDAYSDLPGSYYTYPRCHFALGARLDHPTGQIEVSMLKRVDHNNALHIA